MKTIYLIERHTGEHDDYVTYPIKAFENKKIAEKWNEIYNIDVQILLKKLRILMLKRREIYGITNLNIVGKSKNIDQRKLKKLDIEEEVLYESYEHEDIDYLIEPTEYKILEIELVTNN